MSAKTLIHVESYTKSKTIQKMLDANYQVIAWMGHVCDLPKKDLGINLDTLEIDYQILPEKKQKIKEVRAMKNVEHIFASDDDREGEGISYHLCQYLGDDLATAKRICFHEITKSAIKNALKTPRTIDMNLVNAYQTRRVLDRVVGFKLSPLLWRNPLFTKFMKTGLSVGRVQSVAIKLIYQREKEVQEFYDNDAQSEFVGSGSFKHELTELKGFLEPHLSKAEVKPFIDHIISPARFYIEGLEKSEAFRNPEPPYTTSTFQQDCIKKLRLNSKKSMEIAQKLYESGLITYMRTDSVNLAQEFVNSVVAYVEQNYGADYAKPRQFKSKVKNAQEAHEAIRPTHVERVILDDSKFDAMEQKVYTLIWNRAIASQMASCVLDVYKIIIKIVPAKQENELKEKFKSVTEVVKFLGYRKLFEKEPTTDNQEEEDEEKAECDIDIFTKLKIGDELSKKSITLTEKFKQQPARYDEAGLIRKLEENGIGRPSTYATIISTILKKEYVVIKDFDGIKKDITEYAINKKNEIKEKKKSQVIGKEKHKMTNTELGKTIVDYLEDNFPEIMDYKFTEKYEKYFDKISLGKREWKDVISKFWETIRPTVNKLELIKASSGGSSSSLLKFENGDDTYVVKSGKFGPYIQKNESTNISIPKGTEIPSLKIKDILAIEASYGKMMEKKKGETLGEYKGKEIKLLEGQYGKYIKYGDANISLYKLKNKTDLESVIAYLENPENQNAEGGETPAKKPFKPFKKNFKK